jgi:hypothetical protein
LKAAFGSGGIAIAAPDIWSWRCRAWSAAKNKWQVHGCVSISTAHFLGWYTVWMWVTLASVWRYVFEWARTRALTCNHAQKFANLHILKLQIIAECTNSNSDIIIDNHTV